ncbi:Aste57867_17009 [Aphanomyces stellatus]|uniref:Aste57867_17009 protein n=1 Tax=Aphanomyces stellatus TaxID=120398 RepID=A0A485L6S4_9STRA|nr:hypothetical protein As57867_016951 [Aphanomyces stellatus]VFT93770.1 Aste57867_17009 [Aphanomyces stellatus]
MHAGIAHSRRFESKKVCPTSSTHWRQSWSPSLRISQVAVVMTTETTFHASRQDSVRASSIAEFRRSSADWVIRPTEDKDSDEYEQTFQRRRRNRILAIVAASVLVIGAAIGITIASIPTTSTAEVKASNNPVVAVSTPSPVLVNETLVGSSGSSSFYANPTTTEVATPEPTTVTPEPTTVTPEPTTVTPEPTTVTPEPTTTTPAPTTTTPAPTTTTPAPTTTTAPPTTTPAPPTTTKPASLQPGMFRFVNNCAESLTLFRSASAVATLAGNGGVVEMDGTAQVATMFYFAKTFLNGDATLFETNFAGGKFWWDISIIPVGCGKDNWDKCLAGKHISFNKPMTVAVSGADVTSGNPTCKTIACGDPSCPDAYKVPNDPQTKVCPKQAILTISVC